MHSDPQPRILITGGDGLLAQAFRSRAPRDFTLISCSRSQFDLLDAAGMASRLDAVRPAAVVNTAAYNLVDQCEVERELSWSLNATAPGTLAGLCAERGIRLVHYGTDYIFDGAKRAPYTEQDAPNPLNHYAAGKLAGERAVLAAGPRHAVLRTSWLFGTNPARPQRSYIHTVLRQALKGAPMRSVTDQLSVPTYVGDLAVWTLDLLRQEAGGLFHAVNDEGLSRWEWTRTILELAVEAGLLKAAPPVEAVTTAFFNSTIRRSDYTWLDNGKLARQLGRPLGSWKTGLREMLRRPLWPEAG